MHPSRCRKVADAIDDSLRRDKNNLKNFMEVEVHRDHDD